LMKANPAKSKSIYAALERLIHPAQMGTLFKALAFLPPPAGPAPGF
jgi:NADH dehydrogenase [ubiquinone] 1 alpha subcomplex assembly factor 7